MNVISTEDKTFLYWPLLFLAIAVSTVWPAPVWGQEAPPPLSIGEFSKGRLNGWEEKEFAGLSSYQLKKLNGKTILEAEAKASASGLFKKVQVDLKKYPYLNWNWRIEKRHPRLEETSKKGDDYSARIYVVVDGGLLFWKTIAINYVWSSSQPVGSKWPNAFAGKNAMLLAVRSGDDQISTWYAEKRNVYQDFKKIFGKEIRYIDAIAIMTDSDNSGGEVKAYYGDISFSAN